MKLLCAPLNRATLSMGVFSWCHLPHKPSQYEATQQDYSCHDRMNMRHQGFYLCTVDAIVLRCRAAKAIGK